MKDIFGHPGYSVDEQGNVYSHRRKVGLRKGEGRGTKVIVDTAYSHQLKQRTGRGGYPVVYLSGGHSRQKYVHRIVAETFLPNPENKPCVNHINFDITDPKLSNLEWVTYSENNKHSVLHGRMAGEKSNFGKLTIKEVIAIRALAETMVRRKDIANMFGINVDYVREIQINNTWKHIPDTPAPCPCGKHDHCINDLWEMVDWNYAAIYEEQSGKIDIEYGYEDEDMKCTGLQVLTAALLMALKEQVE
jgi:hypothetical protein